MKISVYNAISIDGFIARKDGDSDWVDPADTPFFEAEMHKAGAILIGGRTFRQFAGEIYPVKGVLNIVLTRDASLAERYPGEIFTVATPEAAVELARSKGHDNLLLVGGGTANGAFLNAGLITKIIVDIHPLIIGEGIRMFENSRKAYGFELLDYKQLGHGLVLARYQMKKGAEPS